ncbi:MAG: hypothetical protein E7231_14880 [Cellulosilyticum sp.]|nr:hypothetical protein [Cellulosilyticum sp.]
MLIQELNERQDFIHMATKGVVTSQVKQNKEENQDRKEAHHEDGVSVTISAEALEKYSEQVEADKLREMYEGQRQDAEVLAKESEDMAKILEIAKRIASGGQVSANEERKLLEYNPNLYQTSKMMASLSDTHKKYKPLFEDEEVEKEKLEDKKEGNHLESREEIVYEDSDIEVVEEQVEAK